MEAMAMVRSAFVLMTVAMFSSPIACAAVSADGMYHGYNPLLDEWSLISEDVQCAVINYDHGTQKLILQASFIADELSEATSAVWFVPIPSAPQEVDIDIIPEFPLLGGHFLRDVARHSVTEDFLFIYSSQLYTIPFALSTVFTLSSSIGDSDLQLLAGGADGGGELVTVFESVVEYGLSSELVGTSSTSALNDYLEEKGLALPESANEVMEEYVGQSYSFVVSWIHDVNEFISEAEVSWGLEGEVYSLGIAVSFPSERIYYPLKLTSVYGRRDIPILLQVIDHGTPVEFASPEDAPQVETYECLDTRYTYRISPEPGWFFQEQQDRGQISGGMVHDVRYSMVLIDGPAEDLTEDLWLEDMASSESDTLMFIYENSIVITLPIFIVLSMVSSLLAGSFIYRIHEPIRMNFAFLGLLNLLTIIGMILGTKALRIEERFLRTKKELLARPRTAEFLVLFSIIFVSLSIVSHLTVNSML